MALCSGTLGTPVKTAGAATHMGGGLLPRLQLAIAVDAAVCPVAAAVAGWGLRRLGS